MREKEAREKEARTGGTKCRTVCEADAHVVLGLVWRRMYIYFSPPPGVGRPPPSATARASVSQSQEPRHPEER